MVNEDTDTDGRHTRRSALTIVAGVGLSVGTIGTGRILADDKPPRIGATDDAQVDLSEEVDWDGNRGSEFATLECDGGLGYWHWVLTPGGQPALEEGATLTVDFEDGSDATAVGYRNGNGDGAVHFDVTKQGGGTVSDATVAFDGGGTNPLLTISDSECRDSEEPGDTPTETPEDTSTETPEDTPTDTPEDTPTETLEDTPEGTPTDTPEDTPTDTPEEPAPAFDDLCVSLECVNGDGTLTVTNDNDVAVSVTVAGPDGYSVTKEVPAGGSVEFAGLANGSYDLVSHHEDVGLEETRVDVDF